MESRLIQNLVFWSLNMEQDVNFNYMSPKENLIASTAATQEMLIINKARALSVKHANSQKLTQQYTTQQQSQLNV